MFLASFYADYGFGWTKFVSLQFDFYLFFVSVFLYHAHIFPSYAHGSVSQTVVLVVHFQYSFESCQVYSHVFERTVNDD